MLQRIIASAVQSLKIPSTSVSIAKWRLDGKILVGLFWAGLIVIAIGLRLPNLGTLGLWGDEGYTAIATKGILDHGYPRLPSDRIYLRSVVFLYMEALSAKVFGLNEFSLRLPSLIMNLGAIWLTYSLAKRLFGNAVGLVAALMMALSNWEIELSRYGRMYAAFQFFYVASLYFFFRGCIEGSRTGKLLIGPVWLLTFMVHELAAVLAAILIVPLWMKQPRRNRTWMLFAVAAAVGFGTILYANLHWVLRFKGRAAGELWAAFSSDVVSLMALPPLDLLLLAFESNSSTIPLVLLTALVGAAVTTLALRDPLCRWTYLYLLLIVIACLLHQIGLAVLLLCLYTVIFSNPAWLSRKRPLMVGCAILSVTAVAWFVYGWFEGIAATRIVSLLFQYPYLYERFLKFFLVSWPLETALCGIAVLLLWKRFATNRDHLALFALVSLLGPLLLVSVVARGADAPRYSFHLFPIMLILASYTIVVACRTWVAMPHRPLSIAICVGVLCIVPSDLQLSDALAIGQRSYNDQIGNPFRTPGSGGAYVFHPDYKTTSQFVVRHLTEGDLVISMLEVIPFYYLGGKIDYLWTPKDADTVPLAPGTGVVPKINFSDLQNLLAATPGKRVWLLEDPIPVGKLKANKSLVDFLRRLDRCTVYRGQDEKTDVYLFSFEEGQPVCRTV